MHADGVSHGFQRDGFQMRNAMHQKSILLRDDFARHFQHGLGALIEAFHQPGRLGMATREESLSSSRAVFAVNLGHVLVVDEHARQGFAVEFNNPCAIR